MNFQELIQRMTELDQPTNERAVGGQPGINRLTGKPMAPAAAEPDHLAEPPERAPADPNAPNMLANKTRMPNPAAAARAQRSAAANDLANQQQPKEGNAFSGALDAARDTGKDEFDVDGKTFKVKEDDVEECGLPGMSNMPSGMMGTPTPKQSDSVTMNVSMNGAGAGGIADLMAILRNIESGEPKGFGDKDADIIIPMGGKSELIGDDYANEPDEMYSQHNMNLGGDLNRPKKAYPISAPGDNTMALESLKNRLGNLYEDIKSR